MNSIIKIGARVIMRGRWVGRGHDRIRSRSANPSHHNQLIPPKRSNPICILCISHTVGSCMLARKNGIVVRDALRVVRCGAIASLGRAHSRSTLDSIAWMLRKKKIASPGIWWRGTCGLSFAVILWRTKAAGYACAHAQSHARTTTVGRQSKRRIAE